MKAGDLPRNALADGRNPLLAPGVRYVWLHGFASGPESSKGRFVRDRLAERDKRLEIPDLNQPSFRELTVTRMVEQVDALLGDDRAVLFGSSLGGYTAATWSARNPGRVASIVLLAPAFDLATRWKERAGEADLRRWRIQGEALFDHYALGRKEPLAIAFLDDAERYEPFPLPDAPTLVLQGKRDDVVTPDLAREFVRRMRGAKREVRLAELDDGHELTADLPRLWREIEAHVQLD
jgi:pimeloyl-ACP methyl ester carboxylesterase